MHSAGGESGGCGRRQRSTVARDAWNENAAVFIVGICHVVMDFRGVVLSRGGGAIFLRQVLFFSLRIPCSSMVRFVVSLVTMAFTPSAALRRYLPPSVRAGNSSTSSSSIGNALLVVLASGMAAACLRRKLRPFVPGRRPSSPHGLPPLCRASASSTMFFFNPRCSSLHRVSVAISVCTLGSNFVSASFF